MITIPAFRFSHPLFNYCIRLHPNLLVNKLVFRIIQISRPIWSLAYSNHVFSKNHRMLFNSIFQSVPMGVGWSQSILEIGASPHSPSFSALALFPRHRLIIFIYSNFVYSQHLLLLLKCNSRLSQPCPALKDKPKSSTDVSSTAAKRQLL